ncbi:MAG: histidinol-phosphate transaminase [Desulfotomaculaceae bacterium]|nr:histidinol-phosphate transaminase [Bacillota bacterium]MDD4766946.1 histidinol-phosphate transaminase [Desulfotomaculaceae bacterium]
MCREDIKFFRNGLAELTPYIPGKPVEEVRRELGLTGRIVRLASNENPIGPSPKAVARMKNVLEEINLYPDGGCYELREALAGKHSLTPRHFILGNGVDNLIPLVVNTFVNSGDEVIIPAPTFAAYRTSTVVAGGIPVEVPLKDFHISVGDIYNAVGPKTKMIFICSPNNPTGTIVYEEDLKNLIDSLPPEVLVVMDEAYYEYVDDPRYPDSIEYLRENENVVVFRTFSKIYGLAGLRLGYGMARPDYVTQMEKIREPFAANRVVQAGALEALADNEFICQVKDVHQKGKQVICDGLVSLGINFVPTEANFIFADLGMDMKFLFPELLKRGVIIRPGSLWGYNTFARITIGTPDENQFFLEQLADVWKLFQQS